MSPIFICWLQQPLLSVPSTDHCLMHSSSFVTEHCAAIDQPPLHNNQQIVSWTCLQIRRAVLVHSIDIQLQPSLQGFCGFRLL